MQLSKNEFKQIYKLKQKKFRKLEKLVIVEGIRLIEQVIANGLIPEKILFLRNSKNPFSKFPSAEITLEQLRKLSFTQNPQNVLAIVPTKTEKIKNRRLLLYLDGVSEPGNLGTIFRTAAAAKIDGIILSNSCCEIWNDKVIRSSLGTIFSLPSEIRSADWLKNQNAHIVASSLQDANNLYQSILSEKNQIIVIGSEAFGISDEVRKICDEFIKIPMSNRVESLNAAIAAGIIIFHYSQQV